TVIVEDSVFDGCLGVGAIHLVGQSSSAGYAAEIRDCWFESNVSMVSSGAGVFVTLYSSAVVDGCTFMGNSSSQSGGAVFLTADTPNLLVTNCVFVGNCADGRGGALYCGAHTVVSGNTLVGNLLRAPIGGGGSAIYFPYPGTATPQNNIIASTAGAAAIDHNPLITVTSACNVFWDNPDGIGIPLSTTDRIADPQFCDATNGDFTVADSSPCLPANSNGCGQIGAFGQGCGAVSVESMSWGRIKAGFRREEGGP
ncbi:MAG TPA: right-handed parallel beta-helix repeat-containing protein, partial [bacterium]|nr:right-handed parallel beta-helix repeat-containing protein [bacterium]